MKSINFPGCNAIYGKDQPEYFPLHAIKTADDIATITCWELDEADLAKVNETKQIFLSLYTFGGSIQPQLLTTELSDVVTFDKPDANLVVPEEQRLKLDQVRKPFTLPEALDKLRRILALDPEYFASWQANIAVQFQDVYKKWYESQGLGYTDLTAGFIQKLSNEAAKNFLNLLIKP